MSEYQYPLEVFLDGRRFGMMPMEQLEGLIALAAAELARGEHAPTKTVVLDGREVLVPAPLVANQKRIARQKAEGERLQKLRKSHGLTQVEAARLTDRKDQSAWSQLENGHRSVEHTREVYGALKAALAKRGEG